YAATFGATPGTPLQQVALAQLIVVWGNNASACNLHLMRQINAAKRHGARLVVIDPRRTQVAEQAHLVLPVRPGTDVVLAWAIAALPALAGKFGVPGGGLVGGASHAFPKTLDRLTRPDLAPPGTRTINILDVAESILDEQLTPPIKAVFVYNHNPIIVHPDQN